MTAVEVMPVAAFPGSRGWGYDGVALYAVHEAYGGPAGFRRFVDACHAAGLAVILDVVYNHLGPDGNYLAEFGPYFTGTTTTAWGPAVNLDGPGSDFVRGFVLDNAEQWVAGYGVDGLRLDAVQALYDRSSVHILEELSARVHAARPGSVVVAESDLHQPLLVTAYGIDAMWADDLHHALHVALTGETSGWYQGFTDPRTLAKAFETGWVFTGQYNPDLDRRHGRDPAGLGGERFVVCSQNHDQVGNRPFGDRLAALVGPELDAVASVLVACSPFLPLLFQGQEWGSTRPFLFFTDHRPELAEAVRRGRRAEFAAFDWGARVPDPNDPASFERSKLDWDRAGGETLELWRTLLAAAPRGPGARQLPPRPDHRPGRPRAAAGRASSGATRRGRGRWSRPTWAKGPSNSPSTQVSCGSGSRPARVRPAATFLARARWFGRPDWFDGALAGRGTTALRTWGGDRKEREWPERRSSGWVSAGSSGSTSSRSGASSCPT